MSFRSRLRLELPAREQPHARDAKGVRCLPPRLELPAREQAHAQDGEAQPLRRARHLEHALQGLGGT